MVLTDDNFYSWIDSHMTADIQALRLSTHARHDIDYDAAITQIECRRKFGAKLAATLAAVPRFYFPSVLAGEQATSDLLASYHASKVADGESVADLTAGLGIDVFHIARRASCVTAVELDCNRAEALRHNVALLGAGNIEVVEGNCIDFIDSCLAEGRRFDTIFIDPARRAADGSRVFALSDCAPDIVALMPRLQKLCRHLLVKASPMLDITHTVNSLPVKPIYVAAVGMPTECKELFFAVDFETSPDSPVIEAVSLSQADSQTFAFTALAEEQAPMPQPLKDFGPGAYLYEASPAMMKAGAFKILAENFGLSIFHPNTRLYCSAEPVDGFPGRRYKVLEGIAYASKNIKRFHTRYPAVEVAVRNFGMGADQLRAKLKVRDAGPLRLYGITDATGARIMILCREA